MSPPPLTILPTGPDRPARRPSDIFGSFYYLAVAGLLVLVAWLAWFGYQAWSLRDLWRDVAVVHDSTESEGARVAAARRLVTDPRFEPRQVWDILIEDELPPRVRFALADGLPAEVALLEPRVYLGALAGRGSWPSWLRSVLILKAARVAEKGAAWPRGPIETLGTDADPAVRLLASFLAAACFDDPAGRTRIESSRDDATWGEFAVALLGALQADPASRAGHFDEATRQLEANHPDFPKLMGR